MRSAIIVTIALATSVMLSAQTGADTLMYGDGKPDGKKSLGGSGELIKFSLPTGKEKVKGIKIYGSRYGYPKPPDEDFVVYILSEDMKDIVHTEKAPYKLFERGENKWVEVKFKKPVEVPTPFGICLDFNAQQTKGVYVSYDTSTGGQFSKIGLPDSEIKDVRFGGDWMIQVELSK
jgi:RNA polymerase sigma-70 factor (ECF subfamily)